MPPAGALFSPISVAFGSMFQTIQCVNKPRGASGSSTIKTSDFASLGTPLIFSSGFTFAPLQVNFAATSPPAWNAGVVTEMEEAAFILRIIPTKIARANEIGFIEQTLAAACRGQARGRRFCAPGHAETCLRQPRQARHPDGRQACCLSDRRASCLSIPQHQTTCWKHVGRGPSRTGEWLGA